jgi:membrane protein YqaA with SNARE-associated domain
MPQLRRCGRSLNRAAMMKRIYDWMMRLAGHPRADLALAGVSFVESSFFPIPPDVMMIPMILADRTKAWRYAAIATVASVIGGAAGYAIGYFAFAAIGQPILAFYGKAQAFDEFARTFNEYGVAIIIIKGMTPIPYKVLTIAAGVTHMALLPFMAASVVARAMRFFLLAALLYWYGPPIREFIEKRLTLVTTVGIAVLVSGFVMVKYLF